ncbi:hypothetical protein BH11MYX3_BH11MYX3_35780 [soil metagenome]
MDNLAISVRRATPRDAAALAELVNEAYAIETSFVEGDRTSEDEIAEMTREGVFLVLEQAGGLAAAVYLELRGHTAYFGMLSVQPCLQGMGLGKRLVRIAEAMAEATGASTMTLRIVNLREELGRWYRSLGYREIGTSPFNRRVKRPCHFVDMHKDLTVVAALETGLGAA